MLRIVASPQARPVPDPSVDTGDLLPARDWHLLFDAVLCRLRAAAARPDGAAGVVRECIEALEWLQRRCEPQARGGR